MGLFDSMGGGALGVIGGLLGQQREGGQDTGNVFRKTPEDTARLQEMANGGLRTAAGEYKYYNPETGTQEATSQVQNNPMLSGLFGQGGTMDRTNAEEQQLASQGFALTPEDRTAYGQISGDIARQFGQSDQSLSQALSDRGLSNSGIAGASFTGSQGNKMEQLAQAQQKIANDRFQANLQRLGQTRSFLSNLGQQGSSNIQSQFNRNQTGVNQNLANSRQAEGMLGDIQGQSNEALKQQQQTAHQSDLSAAFNGGMSGAMAGGGMSGGGGGGGQQKMMAGPDTGSLLNAATMFA